MIVKITLSEGRQYSVESVGIIGNEKYETEELLELIQLKEEEIFSKKIVSNDVQSITEFYSDRGYAMVSIDPQVQPVLGKDVVDVSYRILEGDIYHIGRVEIAGNTKTKDKVIRREIRLDEGELFNGSKLKRSYQRLFEQKTSAISVL